MGLYMVLGVVIALIGFNLMHDGTHSVFSRIPWVNTMMAHSLNLLGGNSMLWSRKHNINHHSYTNIESVDADIELGPFLRLHPKQEGRWYHRYQHIYAIGLYGLTYILWIYYLDFKKYFSGKIARGTRIPPMKPGQHVIFWLSKAVHVLIFLVFPIIMLGAAKAVTGYVLAALLTGFIIAIIFQLAHIVEGTGFETPEGHTAVIDVRAEWVIHQLNTTANFATGNRLLSWLIGGLNFQMVHHLFPRISHVHYPAIRPIIIGLCEKYDVKYIEFPGLRSAIASHLRHLKQAGRAPKPSGPEDTAVLHDLTTIIRDIQPVDVPSQHINN